MISIIAAVSRDRVIGKGRKLPWHLPSDMARFRKLTIGHPIIMGRKTYDSLDDKCRPLPGRANIVLSRSNEFQLAKGTVCHSWEETQKLVAKCEESFVIGGASIFELALLVAKRLYLTIVETACEGDTFFPEFEKSGWEMLERSPVFQNAGDDYPMSFVIYQHP